jgi:integrase
MASLNRDGDGFTIQVCSPDGKRRSVRLGKVPKKTAEAFKVRVEELATLAALGQSPGLDLAKWLARLSDQMHDRLSRAGLCPPRRTTNLKAFLDRYLESRTDLAPGTLEAWRMWADELLAFLGDVALAGVTAGDVDRFVAYLRTEHMPSTAARRARGARSFFEAARRQGLMPANPADHLRCGSPVNTARRHFVDRATFALLLDSCPDANWRCIFCLARYGALRVPSETSLLRWPDVAWDHARMTVTSPKTARAGKAARIVPLFPELAGALREAWELAPEGAVYVLPERLRRRGVNLRESLRVLCRKAGILPWGKPFTNLRASRVTELVEEYPSHVVNAWCGHTEAVSQAHYRQVTEAHFARAAGDGPPPRLQVETTRDKSYPQ